MNIIIIMFLCDLFLQIIRLSIRKQINNIQKAVLINIITIYVIYWGGTAHDYITILER